MNPKPFVILVAALMLSGLPYRAVHALTGDSTQPINIEADSAEYDDKTGESIYRGRVRLIQGSMVLTGNVVTITAPNQELEKIVSEGNLATFKMLQDDGSEVYAEAEYLEYNLKGNEILLLRRAWVEQGNNKIASDRILYDTLSETMDAGDPEQGSRVKMTITPDGDQSEP